MRVVESNAEELITIYVEGGELFGFGSARQRTEECYQDKEETSYYGRTLAVARVKESVSPFLSKELPFQ